MKTSSRAKNIQVEVSAGSVLIAKPFWNDETYKRSVILLINHSTEGTTGVMINKISNLSVHDALPELAHHAPLLYGGTINKKTISYVHSNPNIPDAYYLGNDLYWGGNYECVQKEFAEGTLSLKDFIFCAGFVQWGPGELMDELYRDKWWVAGSDISLLHIDSDQMWGELLISEEHIYGLLSPYPDPSFN